MICLLKTKKVIHTADMQKSTRNRIIQEVTEGYDNVADKFSHTRNFFWADLEFIQDLVSSEDRILDFGCGNGRLAGFLKGKCRNYLGVDVSKELLKIAEKNNPDSKNKFLVLPKEGRGLNSILDPQEKFDKVFSLAVFHHLPSNKYREEQAKILYDITRPGGVCVVSVWNLATPNYLKIFLKDKLFNRKNLKPEFRDFYLPFKTPNYIFHRFLHIFTLGELRQLFELAGFKTLEARKGTKNLIYVGKRVF